MNPRITTFQLEHHTVCSKIRILDPLQALEGLGRCQLSQGIWPEGEGMMSVKFRPDEMDVAVFQRHFCIEQQNEVFRQLLTRGIPMVFDIDDDFLNVPDDHIHAHQLLKIRPNVMKLLSISDCVTVTTEELQALYAPHCQRVEIIRNTLNPALWTNPRRWTQGGPLVVGYAGSATHEGDLKMVEQVLMDFLDAHKGAVELHLWGCATDRLQAHPHVRFRESYKGDYHDYARAVQTEPMDIALAPLESLPFNRAKSALKWKEYAVGSIPSIVSRIPAYERVVEEGVTGFICDTPTQWRETLERLVADPALRRKVGEEARRRMTAEYSLEKAVQRWEEVLGSVVRREPKPKKPGPYSSIIIPVFNRCELTEKCLEAVFRNPQEHFEVLVVDNA
ncbi:MAG: glycosyltransferase, partial [Planctomycetota bacterium]